MKKLLIGIFTVLFSIPAMAIDITGTVVDENGEPLPGATISTPDGKRGTATGLNGEFTMKNFPDDSNVRVSYISYAAQELTPQANMGQIKMQPSTTNLNEVTVAGTWKSRPCTAEELKKINATSGNTARKSNGDGIYCVPTKCTTGYRLDNQQCTEIICTGRYKINDTKTDCEDQVGKNCTSDDTNAIDPKYTWDGTNLICSPSACKPGYKLNGNKCTEITCTGRYKINDEKTDCEDQVGKDCQSNDTNATKAKYEWDDASQTLKCVIGKCKKGYLPNSNGTACDVSEGPCSAEQLGAIAHATAGELRKGVCYATDCEGGYDVSNGKCVEISGNCKPMPTGALSANRQWDAATKQEVCIIDTCKDGYTRSNDKKSCLSPQLSAEDQKKKIAELEKNAQDMKKKEQSTANKLIGAAAIGATGIGGMNTLSALAEQQADENAEDAMKAYLETFRCNYGGSLNIKGGERDIVLPGGNALSELYTEYTQLAADLKIRKDALGMRPGIESEEILDKANTGLYDDVGTGITGGAYTSISRALQNPSGEDAAEWQKQKDDTASKLKTGLITTAAGVGIGIAGNTIANAKAPKEDSANINRKYESMKKIFDDTQAEIDNLPQVEQPKTCPNGTSGTYPECRCADTKSVYKEVPNQSPCTKCPGDKIADSTGTKCVCPENTVPGDNNTCNPKTPDITPECDNGDHVKIDPATGKCTCTDGYQKQGRTCVCPNATHELNTQGLCVEKTQTSKPAEKITLLAKNTFAHGSYKLTDSAKQVIAKFAGRVEAAAAGSTNYCITVVGHTDKTGTDKINVKLSNDRANAVKDVLVQNGIPTTNIKTSGRSSLDCTLDGKQESCRKVEIKYQEGACYASPQSMVQNITQTITTAATAAVVNNTEQTKSTADTNNTNTPTPLTAEEMRQKMSKIVNICENYNQNGVICKFVSDTAVNPWSQYDSTYHQRAYCIFVKPATTNDGLNDPTIANSAEKYREKLNKYAMNGYVYAPDNAQGLRCRNLFAKDNPDLGGILYHGQDLPTGSDGNYTACEFSYQF